MRPCAKSGLVVIFTPHRRQGFLPLTPHLLVTLFRIRVIFLITLLPRKITPFQTVASFSLVLTLEITPLRTAATFFLALIHLLTKPILTVCRTLLFSETINMLALVEVFFTPLHSVAIFGVRTRIPTINLNELCFKVMRMCSSRGDLCAGSLGTLLEYRRCILNVPCTRRAAAAEVVVRM